MSASNLQRNHRTALERQDRLVEWSRRPDFLALAAPKVSAWSVGQHVDHLGKVASFVVGHLERVLAGRAETGLGGPRPSAYVVLGTGWLPRGKAPAPKSVAPGNLEPPALESELAGTRERLASLGADLPQIAALPGKVRHPVLGPLNAGQWLRFLIVHDHHHYKIIRDIQQITPARSKP
ncbi:MAG: DinB family protein [Acidobacteriota bacterium]